jgi:hypothetical protein
MKITKIQNVSPIGIPVFHFFNNSERKNSNGKEVIILFVDLVPFEGTVSSRRREEYFRIR